MASIDKQKENAQCLLDAYISVINILSSCKDTVGVSRISQTEIAKMLGISQTAVAKRFKNLTKFGAISKAGPRNAYIVLKTDLLNHSPIGLLYKLMTLLKEQPDIVNDYYKQAEQLNVSYKEVQVARGYLTFLIT
ncbi:winged helix-turn-helix transcriptional regulator [Paenibacillus thailandensis]|uniref:Winged helix-turn-helix transcriptional regulator n=1 Tax=Paenibacillus thailandensis TaxID=393250 RepID=A0ABW5R2I9_9BACL